MPALKVGDEAPDFELKNAQGEPVRLSDEVKRQPYTVLAFFPAAFSSVCTNELNVFQEATGDFRDLGAAMVTISVDNHYALREFAQQNGLGFLLLSDFHPQGQVAAAYGVLNEDGMTERALFIVDQNRKIRYSQVVERKVNPGADGLLEKLEELKGTT
jgi:mycoredoxin-dependent peroxiredoxin